MEEEDGSHVGATHLTETVSVGPRVDAYSAKILSMKASKELITTSPLYTVY